MKVTIKQSSPTIQYGTFIKQVDDIYLMVGSIQAVCIKSNETSKVGQIKTIAFDGTQEVIPSPFSEPAPLPEIKSGMLVEARDEDSNSHRIVLVLSYLPIGDSFEGVQLYYTGPNEYIGKPYSTDWGKQFFTPFTGMISLQND